MHGAEHDPQRAVLQATVALHAAQPATAEAALQARRLLVDTAGCAPAVSDLLAGQVQMMVDGLPSALPHVKAGKLRAIALTSLRRAPSLPELPTIAETYPGFYADAWSGLFAPRGTPQPVVDKLSAEVQRILKLPDVREKLTALGAEPVGSTQAEFAAHVKKEIDKWAKVVKTSGAKVD